MQRSFSIVVFILFFCTIVAATLHYSPGWGLMDDYENLGMVAREMHSAAPVVKFFTDIWDDTTGWGIFRPIYHVWIFIVYDLFNSNPTAIYVLLAVFNMSALLVWGRVYYTFYNVDKDFYYLSVYIFPLSCFLFTPFWNIFMYISVQEKFVVLFGALSFYFFKRSYDQGQARDVFLTFLFFLLGLFSKPTILALAVIYAGFAVLDGVLFRIRPALSLLYFIGSCILAIVYSVFSFKVEMKGIYTSSYGHHLKFAVLLGKLSAAGLAIKGLLALSIGSIFFFIVRFIMTRDKNFAFGVLFPSALLVFLGLLTPWGYPPYLLSDLAPFIFGIFFPSYIYLVSRGRILGLMTNGVLIFLLAIVFVHVIEPRIAKIADITKTERFIIDRAAREGHSRYFLPPPFRESAYALNGFTKEDIVFIEEGQLKQQALTGQDNNYLLVNDQCTGVTLQGVRVENEIFANGTWKIFHLIPDPQYTGEFHVR